MLFSAEGPNALFLEFSTVSTAKFTDHRRKNLP